MNKVHCKHVSAIKEQQQKSKVEDILSFPFTLHATNIHRRHMAHWGTGDTPDTEPRSTRNCPSPHWPDNGSEDQGGPGSPPSSLAWCWVHSGPVHTAGLDHSHSSTLSGRTDRKEAFPSRRAPPLQSLWFRSPELRVGGRLWPVPVPSPTSLW